MKVFTTHSERKIVSFLRRHPFAICTLTLLLSLLVIWLLPKWQVSDLSSLTSRGLFDAENTARVTIAQIIGGILLLVGIYFTWWRIEEAEETRNVSREGQLTERFSRAVEHLGSERLEIRLGGIYALERIAHDSERDHWPVVEVLTAFVRENASWTGPSAESAPTTGLIEPTPRLRADVQAILTVLGRRNVTHEANQDRWVDLRKADLRNSNLSAAKMENSIFTECCMELAFLGNARLNKSVFIATNLAAATLWRASIDGGTLNRANLRGADLRNASLKGCSFDFADLSQSDLRGADLEGATGLTKRQIASARTDDKTRRPTNLIDD